MDTNVILSICQIAAVAIIPFLVWLIGFKAQNRQLKISAKMQLFLKLMAKRNVNDITQEWVDALNVIEVVFQDDKKVCKAWKDYHNSLYESSLMHSQKKTYRLQLLSEMSQSLGYKELKYTDIAEVYKPKSLKEKKNEIEEINHEYLRVLKNSKSFSESMDGSKK